MEEKGCFLLVYVIIHKLTENNLWFSTSVIFIYFITTSRLVLIEADYKTIIKKIKRHDPKRYTLQLWKGFYFFLTTKTYN